MPSGQLPPAESRRHTAKRFFHALGGRKLFLALGPVVAACAAAASVASISIMPPSVKLKHLAYSIATTQYFVASEHALSSTKVNGGLYSTHMQALADVMVSPDLRRYIARAAGISPSGLAIDAPVWGNLQRTQQEPTEQKRSAQLLTEGDLYRVTLDVDPATSVIGVTAQAPSADGAIALADGAGRGLVTFLLKLQRTARTSQANRIELNQLVPAAATPVSLSGVGQVAAFTFAAVIAIWIVLVWGVSRFLRELRDPRREERRRSVMTPALPAGSTAAVPGAGLTGPSGVVGTARKLGRRRDVR
jgi:hypothetical protein